MPLEMGTQMLGEQLSWMRTKRGWKGCVCLLCVPLIMRLTAASAASRVHCPALRRTSHTAYHTTNSSLSTVDCLILSATSQSHGVNSAVFDSINPDYTPTHHQASTSFPSTFPLSLHLSAN